MSVYNGERYLKEAIDSILNQTYKDFELIMVNDGSTDNSEKIILEYEDSRIRYIKRNNCGLAASLNHAVNISHGKFIARMDADDISYPQRLKLQYDCLTNNPNCIMTGSNADVIDMYGNYLYTSNLPVEHRQIVMSLDKTSPFFHSSAFYRKDTFLKCGGYYEPVRHHVEDFILWNKLKNYGILNNIVEPLIKYRIVPEALTNRESVKTNKMINIAKDIISGKRVPEEEMKLFYTNDNRKRSRLYSNYFCKIGCIYLYKSPQKRLNAIYHFIHALRYNLFNIHALFFILLSLMPGSIINRWKKIRKITRYE